MVPFGGGNTPDFEFCLISLSVATAMVLVAQLCFHISCRFQCLNKNVKITTGSYESMSKLDSLQPAISPNSHYWSYQNVYVLDLRHFQCSNTE